MLLAERMWSCIQVHKTMVTSMGGTAVSIYKFVWLFIPYRIPGMPSNAQPAQTRHRHKNKRQSLPLFSTPPYGRKWMQDLERDENPRSARPLMGFKGIVWPTNPASLWF